MQRARPRIRGWRAWKCSATLGMAGLIGQAVYADDNRLHESLASEGENSLAVEAMGEAMQNLADWIISKRYSHDGIFVFKGFIVEIYEHSSWENITSMLITFWINTTPALFIIFSGDGHVRHVHQRIPDRAIGA